MKIRVAAITLLTILAVTLVACDSESSDLSLPEGGLSEAEAPAEEAPAEEAPAEEAPAEEAPAEEAPAEEAPAEEAPAEEAPAAQEETGDDDGIPVEVLVIIGLLLVGIIVFFAARSGSKGSSQTPQPVQSAAPVPEWKSNARTAYAEARWLHDQMDVPLATWRGDALHKAQDGSGGATADPAHQATWNQLSDRMNEARDALYRVESTAPDPKVGQLATVLVNDLNDTRAAVDRLAEARRERRAINGGVEPAGNIEEARAAETRATEDLAADRRRLADGIQNLFSAI